MLRSTCPVCDYKLPQPADRCPKCPTDFAEWQRTTTLSHRVQPREEKKSGRFGVVAAIVLAGLIIGGAVLWKRRDLQGEPMGEVKNFTPLLNLDAPHPVVPTLAPEPTAIPESARRWYESAPPTPVAPAAEPLGPTARVFRPAVLRRSPPPNPNAGPTDNNGNDETCWRNRIADWQRRVDAQQQRVNDALAKANAAASAPDRLDAQVAAYTQVYKMEERQLEAIKAERAQMDEECRKAGCLPGWLR